MEDGGAAAILGGALGSAGVLGVAGGGGEEFLGLANVAVLFDEAVAGGLAVGGGALDTAGPLATDGICDEEAAAVLGGATCLVVSRMGGVNGCCLPCFSASRTVKK